MKKIFMTLAGAFVMVFSANAQEQIGNSGFESWTSNKPTGWKTLSINPADFNPLLPSMEIEIATGSVSKSTTSHGGTAAVKLQPKVLNPLLATVLTQIPNIDPSTIAMLQTMKIPGFLTNGDINVIGLINLLAGSGGDFGNIDVNELGQYITNGALISQLPMKLQGYLSFTQVDNTDSYAIVALCFNGTGEARTLTGAGLINLSTPSANYEPFELLIAPIGATASEIIVMAVAISGTQASEPTLLLDDLVVVYGSDLADAPLTNEITVYPNPSNGSFAVNCTNGSTLEVTNMLGQEVLTIKNYRSGSAVNIAKKGIYFVRIDNGNTQITRKLVVK